MSNNHQDSNKNSNENNKQGSNDHREQDNNLDKSSTRTLCNTQKPTEQEDGLRQWVHEQLRLLGLCANRADVEWEPILGDAGFRRYFRIAKTSSLSPLIAVIAPVETENSAQFCRVSEAFQVAGVHTPSIYAKDFDRGFMLLEDLGDRALLDELTPDTVDGLYDQAMNILSHIQQCELDTTLFPMYDKEKLVQEMSLFSTWFVTNLVGYDVSNTEKSMLDETFDRLAQSALSEPQVVVHRDYHSRNLMCGSDHLGVIDFQDAVIGPMTYDLVSLLKDCYIRWDEEKVNLWALSYAHKALEKKIIQDMNPAMFLRCFDWMGLQRHIKVLGVFARLSLRDNKHAYLNDLPMVVHYVRSTLRKYPELSAFEHWFEETLWPLFQHATWMSVK